MAGSPGRPGAGCARRQTDDVGVVASGLRPLRRARPGIYRMGRAVRALARQTYRFGRWFIARRETPWRVVFVTGPQLDFAASAARHLGVERGVLLERIHAAGAVAVGACSGAGGAE